jgi:hypothetical protein
MREEDRTHTMFLVTDVDGRVVAAAHESEEGEEREASVGISALPGQTIHKVSVPGSFAELPGHELAAALAHARIKPDTNEFHFPEIEVREGEHRED